MIQIETAPDWWNSCARVGSATFATLLSSTDIAMASAMAATAQYRRGTGSPSRGASGAPLKDASCAPISGPRAAL